MSKVVDSKVVEMRFDNAQFERGVRTTLSTLDKLKQKLNFSGASKGLETIGKSAQNINMADLGRTVDAVKVRFSALQVIGVTALSKITSSAMRTEKALSSALTIDPIKDGFKEYETQMGAVQTILANTQKEGTTIKDVNKALDELNTYADKTIYNFTEMTRNIGTFTAAGVKLDASVSAIKGIANLAAVSGSTSQQASTAMYQLSQALAAGKVQLMDWNSVVNAGMGGQVFQDALIRTSEHLGTGAKAYIEATGSFRNSLEKGWLTTDVLTQTLDQFATAADTQEEYAAAVKKFVDQGYSEDQAKQMADMAKTAGDAATKVKTFSQLIDTLKEALGSGWTKTWQLIIGDFEVAKEMWTKVSDVLGGMINKASDARNALVEKVMGNPYSELLKSISDVTDKAEGLEEVVNNVIRGDYGNGQPRFDKLAEQGYNWARVQNMVNEQLGCAYRYNEELGGSQEDLQKTQAETIAQLVQMSDAQLEENGFTKDQIEALRELQEQSEKTGVPLQDLLNSMTQMSGRDLLFGSFENVGKTLMTLFSSLKQGWNDVFNPPSAYTLYNILQTIYAKTSELFVYTEDHSDQLRRTMAGLAAALDIIRMFVGGALKFGIKALNAVLSTFGMDTLDATASLGDLLVQFDKWLKVVDPFEIGFEKVGEGVKFLINRFKELYEYLNKIPQVKKVFDSIKGIDFEKIGSDIFNGIKNFNFEESWDNLIKSIEGTKAGKKLIDSFKKGLKEGITSIPEVLIEIGKEMLTAIKNVLDIHSPSKKAYDVGWNFILGLFNALKDGASNVLDFLKGLGSDMVNVFGDIDWKNVAIAGTIGTMIFSVKKLADAIDKFSSPFDAIGNFVDGLAGLEESISKKFKADAMKSKMNGIKSFAEALVIVAASIYILGNMDLKKMAQGGIAVAIIAGVLVGIAAVMNHMSKVDASVSKKGLNIKGLKTNLASIGVAILLIGATVKLIGDMDPKKAEQGFVGLRNIIIAMGALFAAIGICVRGEAAKNIDKVGKMMKKIAMAMILMAAAVKIIGTLSAEEMLKGAGFVSAFVVFVGLLSTCAQIYDGDFNKFGKSVASIVVALGLMVGVVKLVGTLSAADMTKGVVFAGAFLLFVKALTTIVKSSNGSHTISGLNKLLLSISVSMALMAGVVKIVGTLSAAEIVKGTGFMAAFVVFVAALTKATTIAGTDKTAKLAGTILAISIAVGVLAGISVLLGMIDTKNLVKGEVAIGALCAMVAIMIRQLRGAGDAGKSIIGMAVAIGVMAAAVAGLSLIDEDKLKASTLALSTLMGMFAVVEKASSTATTSLKTIVLMTAVVAALAGMLVLLNHYDFTASAKNASSISALLLALSTATVVLGKPGEVSNSALKSVAVMTALMAGVAVVLGIMDKLDIEANVQNAVALGIVMNAIASACLIASKMSVVPPGTSKAITELSLTIGAIATVFTVIGGLLDLIPGAEEFLDGGIRVLQKIGTGLGEFVGSIIGGIGEGITNTMPAIGENIAGFINAFSKVSDSATSGLDTFAKFVETILGLTVANIIDSIAEKLGFKSGLDNFGEQAEKFGQAMGDLSDALTGNPINEDAIKAAVNAGEMLSNLKNSLPKDPGAVLGLFTTNQNLENFGEQAKAFGKALSAMSKAVSGENAIDENAIESAKKAGELLATLKNSLPPDPGAILGLFTTNQNLGNFGEQAKQFGEAISAMSKAVSGDNTIDQNAVDNAKKAGELLVTLKDSLPSDPGAILGLFTSNKNLGDFGVQAQQFGEALSAMSKAVSGENAIDEDAVNNAKNAGIMLTELQNAIPDSHWFDGKVSLSDFGANIQSFGYGLKAYSDYLADIDVSKIASSLTQAVRFVSLTKQLASNSDNISNGVDAFKDFECIGESIQLYSGYMEDVDLTKLSDSVAVGYKLKSFISSLKDIDTSGVSGFKDAVDKLGKVELGNIRNTLNDSSNSFLSTGKSLVETLGTGVTTGKSTATNAMAKVVSAMLSEINSRNEKYKQAGVVLITALALGMQAQRENVVRVATNIGVSAANGALNPAYSYMNNNGRNLGLGLVYGINSMQQSAYNAGFNLGQAAVRGERDGQKSHSPSKATYQSGIWLGEGLINACHDIAYKVNQSGRALGEGIVNTISSAMQSADSMIDSDGTMSPVISPVVDLTNIKRSASQITDLFNNPSVTPMSNIRAISGMMNERQNGNADVVNAINGLKKSIGNTGNTYNTISGITYDDGSNVSDAIETLVRAAKIERRR